MLLKGILLVTVLTPLCWIGVLLALHWIRRALPGDPFLVRPAWAISRR